MSASKQIVITGISSNLGVILATELSKEPGMKIIGTMRRSRKAKDVFPSNIHVLDCCDLCKPKCCSMVADATNSLFDGPFSLVHCAGAFWDHVSFLKCGIKEANTALQSNVTTLYNILQLLVPEMKNRQGGAVLAFSCNSAMYHYPLMAAFTAAKSAVDSLVISLANEYSEHNLRFNSLRLSSLQTDPVRRSKPHGDFANFLPPVDLVPIVRFLLSTEAYLINGNNLNLFKHSREFYRKGYFERVKNENNSSDV